MSELPASHHIGTHPDRVCINPADENPEEWACDCYANWKAACEAKGQSSPQAMASCLTRTWCDKHDHGIRLCENWRAKNCDQRSSLVQRASLLAANSRVSTARRSLDGTLTTKACT